MSYLHIIPSPPNFKIDSPTIFGELIRSFVNLSVFTDSLKDEPFGADKFMIGLIFVGWATAISGFTRKFFNGGRSNGPATKPFLTQLAKVSVICSPKITADSAFLHL